MSETAEQQRTRILFDYPDTYGWEYDLAVELGYQPESWDGMWKLIVHPFTFQDGAIYAEEVISEANAPRITQLVRHELPQGWDVVTDTRLNGTVAEFIFYRPGNSARV